MLITKHFHFLKIFFLCIFPNFLSAALCEKPLFTITKLTKTEKTNTPSNNSSKNFPNNSSKGEEPPGIFNPASIEPPKIGNFSLPSSQQPAPLIGFGERVLEKGQTQLFLFADAFIGNHSQKFEIIPIILHGITDKLSISFSVPFTTKNKINNHTSSGIEDSLLQLEYAYYSKKNICFYEQASIVGNVTFPTGSSKKNPSNRTWGTQFFWRINVQPYLR